MERVFQLRLEANGYQGAMSIEHEDPFYGADDNPGPDFSEPYKVGFIMAQAIFESVHTLSPSVSFGPHSFHHVRIVRRPAPILGSRTGDARPRT